HRSIVRCRTERARGSSGLGREFRSSDPGGDRGHRHREDALMAGEIWDAPNKQVLGLDPPWVEGTGGGAEPKKAEGQKLPGQHAGLDELAAGRGQEMCGAGPNLGAK